jgi:hypothetical protein
MAHKRTPRWTAEHCCPQYDPAHDGIAREDYHDHFGSAISNLMRYEANSARWWIGNGEYASPIRFCPWCGVDLATLTTGEWAHGAGDGDR